MIVALLCGVTLGISYAAMARRQHEYLIGVQKRPQILLPLILTITRFLGFFIVGLLVLRTKVIHPVPLSIGLVAGYVGAMTFYLRKR